MDLLLKDLADEEEDLRRQISGIRSLADLENRIGVMTEEEIGLLEVIAKEPMPELGLDPEQFERIRARVMENLGKQEN